MHPYDKALDIIWDRINITPPMHSEDFAAIVDLFDRLLRAGKHVNSVDDIGNYLMGKGMGRDMARNIQTIYEFVEIVQGTSKHPHWNDALIKELLA